MQSASVVMNFNLDESNYSVVMDTVNSLSVNESVNVTEHPLVNGDMVADHIIRQPNTYSLIGAFSMGNKQGIVVNNGRVELNEIQSLFSRVMKEGIVLSLYKIVYNGDKSPTIRFTQKENLVITGINWDEKITTLGATFNFKQIQVSNVISYDEDVDDEFLPKVKPLDTKNFSDTLLNDDEVIKAIIQILYNNEFITLDFAKVFANKSAELIAIGGAVGLAGVVIATSVAIVAGTLSATGIGLVIVGFVAIVAGLVYAVIRLAKFCKFKNRPFKKGSDKEIQRFMNMIQDMTDELKELNNYIKIYQVPYKDDASSILSINDTYYLFEFNTNNTNGTRRLTLSDINDNEIAHIPDISSSVDSYNDCTGSNALYVDKENNTYIHLVYVPTEDKDGRKDLRNYAIVVSAFNPEEFSTKFCQIIESYIYK